MVEDKDIVMVIVPSTLTLSALLLVVVGLLLREFSEGLLAMEPLTTAKKAELLWFLASVLGVGLISLAVISGLIASTLGMGWMLGLEALYVFAVILFFTTIGSAVLAAIALVLQILLRPRSA